MDFVKTGYLVNLCHEIESSWHVLIRLLQQTPMRWGQDMGRSATPRVWLQQPDKQKTTWLNDSEVGDSRDDAKNGVRKMPANLPAKVY